MKRNAATVVLLVLAATVMLSIFLFSSQTASDSKVLSDWVKQEGAGMFPFVKKLLKVFPVRKVGHFLEFFLLGFLFAALEAVRKGRVGFFSFPLCFLYACSDEFHQLFVEGRGASVRDVAIDFAGSSFGVLFFAVLFSITLLIKHLRKGKVG